MELKLGRKLDALVAEKVMGFRALGNATSLHPDMPALIDLNGTEVYPSQIKNYSTSIADAWEVVDKIRGPKMAMCLITSWDRSNDSMDWLAKVEFWGTSRFEFATSSSAPHAICLAALKACGVEI
jgi:hypothetical protein